MLEEISNAIEFGHYFSLKKAILDDKYTYEQIIAEDKNGWRLEHYLAGNGQSEILEILEQKYQIISNNKPTGKTEPVHCAAYFGQLEIVKLYAHVNASTIFSVCSENGNTAHFAAKNNQTNIIVYLSARYPNSLQSYTQKVNFPTVLDTAVEFASIGVIQVLLANLFKFTESSICAAIRGGNPKVLADIYEYANIKPTQDHMIMAAQLGRTQIMALLHNNYKISYGPDNYLSSTPMQVAARNYQWDTVMFLHENGVKPYKDFDSCNEQFEPYIAPLLDTVTDKHSAETVVTILKSILETKTPADALFCERSAFNLKRILLEDTRRMSAFKEDTPRYNNQHSFVVLEQSPYEVLKSTILRTKNVLLDPGDITAALCITLKTNLKEWEFKKQNQNMTEDLSETALTLRKLDQNLTTTMFRMWHTITKRTKMRRLKEETFKQHKSLLLTKNALQREHKSHVNLNPELANQLQLCINQAEKDNQLKNTEITSQKQGEICNETMLHWHKIMFKNQFKKRKEAYQKIEKIVNKFKLN